MVDFDKFFDIIKKNIITIFVLISIIYSDSKIQKDTFNNIKTIISILILTILFWFRGKIQTYDTNIMLVLYSLYVITIYGYTFYQWDVSSRKTDKECSFTIPRTKNFNDLKYYLYRVIYLTTTIVIITLIQNILDKGGDLSTWKINPQNFVIILPLLLPFLTELVNAIVNFIDVELLDNKYSINPESLLSNFMLGDSKSDIFTFRLIMPVLFYILVVGYAYYCSYIYQSTTPIYILLMFTIGFSIWMRTIFIQNCSLSDKKDIAKTENYNIFCIFEKYGGVQTMIATCFLVSMLSYIKNPTYKLFIFMIVGLASGLLSSIFILNLKS